VALDGASDGRARQPLFDQVAQTLAPLGVAVLSYEPPRVVKGGDTPLHVQAADPVAAMRALGGQMRRRVGVFGFSQGAWAATLAAADEVAGFLVVLGCSGVSPAEQMRFHTDELLRRRGFGDQERSRLRGLRIQVEDYLRAPGRTRALRNEVAAALRHASLEPWFQYAYLAPEPPPDEVRWSDMDFDPVPSFGSVKVPVLALWGADEECVPRQASRDAWRASGANVTLVDLPECGHWPVVGSGRPGWAWEAGEVSRDFAAALTAWLQPALHAHR
jgi:uncharacterized protein